ncbi:hypothetical protein CTheo_1490 [Ceratobasidium theobromae]|uniref:Uncharacterized protein n=1 Tax=Ceratobasidium theobromae TaxID=1582974 RepID=A0A5N5QTR9_9AGAM|nr:hypothetical protein CTheo_1490 [Ceratobasidium theobromae]
MSTSCRLLRSGPSRPLVRRVALCAPLGAVARPHRIKAGGFTLDGFGTPMQSGYGMAFADIGLMKREDVHDATCRTASRYSWFGSTGCCGEHGEDMYPADEWTARQVETLDSGWKRRVQWTGDPGCRGCPTGQVGTCGGGCAGDGRRVASESDCGPGRTSGRSREKEPISGKLLRNGCGECGGPGRVDVLWKEEPGVGWDDVGQLYYPALRIQSSTGTNRAIAREAGRLHTGPDSRHVLLVRDERIAARGGGMPAELNSGMEPASEMYSDGRERESCG